MGLFAFYMLGFTTIMVGFTPVTQPVSIAFNESISKISFCAISFSAFSLPMTFVSIYLYSRYKYIYILRIAVMMQLTGVWIRVLSTENNLLPCLVGTCLVAMALPISIGAIGKINIAWFGDDERTVATAIGGAG